MPTTKPFDPPKYYRSEQGHSAMCLFRYNAYTDAYNAYIEKWPNACHRCGGRGLIITWDSLPSGTMEPCPDCTDNSRCSRCGQSLPNATSDTLPPCPHCGHTYTEAEMIPFWEGCLCGEY